MTISSPAFEHQSSVPAEFTCEGQNQHPPLDFFDVPTGTASLAIIMEDPDSPNRVWQHWLVWNIDPKTRNLAMGELPKGATEGMTDFGRSGYGGPCPAHGKHRYFIKLLALDAKLLLDSTASRPQLDEAMAGHILAEASLIGTFQHTVGHETKIV